MTSVPSQLRRHDRQGLAVLCGYRTSRDFAIDSTSQTALTPLHLAAIEGSDELVRRLLSNPRVLVDAANAVRHCFCSLRVCERFASYMETPLMHRSIT